MSTEKKAREPQPVVGFDAAPRRMAYTIVSVLGLAFALQWAAKFFIPVALGIIVTYTLNPIVKWLERRRVHRWLGATAVTLLLVLGGGFLAVSIQGQVSVIVAQLPDATHRLHELIGGSGSDPNILQTLQKAQQELDPGKTAADPGHNARHAPTHIVVDDPSIHWGDLMWQSSLSVAEVISQLLIVLFLVFFLLLSGDAFKRKLIRRSGPSLSRKKITVRILNEIDISVQRYMLALVATNVLLALLTWALFRGVGLNNAAAWGVAAGLLHLIPYFGPMLTATLTAGAMMLQGGSLSLVLIASGGSLLIAVLVGVLLTTWMTGRITRMNPVAVFISLLFWSWLWGVWGALLAVPITGIIRVVCEHVRPFKLLAEMLGE